MKMRYFSLSLVLVSFTTGDTLRAVTKPHADRSPEANRTWTNDDLERLSSTPGLISIVGQVANEDVQDAAPAPLQTTEDPAWYAAQAASLNAQLETEQANLRDFTRALDNVRELKSTTGGIDLAGDDIGITPEATIDILQSRVRETQSELDALADLARQNNIPPGILRGQ